MSKAAKKTNGKAKPKATKPATKKAQTGGPLFYKDLAVLDHQNFKSQGLKGPDYSFAKKTNSVPLNTAEFMKAAKDYPIVLTTDEHAFPVAVMGLEDFNYFVGEDNQWNEGYMPAYIRRYPFNLMPIEGKKLVLCIDQAAGTLHKKPEKDLRFFEGKEPSEMTQRALAFCQSFHAHAEVTAAFCAALKEQNLLVSYQSEATLENGRKVKLDGFNIIDEEAFNALPDDIVVAWHKNGYLRHCHYLMQSMDNWQKLVAAASKLEQPRSFMS